MLSVSKKGFDMPRLAHPAPWQREIFGDIRKALRTGEKIKVRLEEYVSDAAFRWIVDYKSIKGAAMAPSNIELERPGLLGRSLMAQVHDVKRDPFSFKVYLFSPIDLLGLTEAMERIKALSLEGEMWQNECLERVKASMRADFPLGAAEILHQAWVNSALTVRNFGNTPIRSDFLITPEDIAGIMFKLTPEEQWLLTPKLRLYFNGNFASEILIELSKTKHRIS